jgi:hypothetical protein
MSAGVLAALEWNVTTRGILFPAIMFIILVGSTYMILATNIGNRLGFLLANAGFWAWMTLMTITWMVYGIGLKGTPPSWRVKEVITAVGNAQSDKVATLDAYVKGGKLPAGWTEVLEGTPTRGEAQSASDAHLVEEKVFKSATEFAHIGGYEIGGAQRLKLRPRLEKGGDWWNPSDYRFMGLMHQKRYYVDRVAPYKLDAFGLPELDAKKKPIIDTTKPVYNSVMVRNLGNLRQPAFKVFLASLIMLIISSRALHKRDRQVMAAMKTRPATA